MGRTERAAAGFLLSLAHYGTLIALQILLAPIILAAAGPETLGAFAILMEAAGYFAILDQGAGMSIGRHLAQAHGQPACEERFARGFTTGRTILICTNGLFGACLLLLAPWTASLFKLSAHVAAQARFGLYLLAAWAFLRSPWTGFAIGLTATQNLAAARSIGIVTSAGRLLLSLALVAGGFGLTGLVLAVIIAEGLTIGVSTWYFRREYPQRVPAWGIRDTRLLRGMAGIALHASVFYVGTHIIYNSSNLVAGYLFGAAAASVYYVSRMPAVLGYVIVTRLSDNVFPAVSELWARSDRQIMARIYLRLQRVMAVLAFPLALGMLLFHRRVIELWVGHRQYAGGLVTFALAVYCLLVSLQHINWVFLMSAGRIRRYSALTMVEAGVNLTLSVVLGRMLGLGGVALAAVLANIPTNLYLQCTVHRELGVSIRFSLRHSWLPSLLLASLAAIPAWAVLSLLPGGRVCVLAASGSIFLILHATLCYAFVLEREDRERLRAVLLQLSRGWSRQQVQEV